MIKKILLGIAAVIAVILIAGAFQPAHFELERSATIAAPAAVVYSHVNDFRKWEAWSPWEKLDPALKRTHAGPASGKGATYSWQGNNQVGEGRMTITDSRPAELVQINLEFIKPFAATNDVKFVFKPAGNQTTVTWSMSGEKNYMSKVMCMFMSMDKMVGGDFEKGLASLKSVSEAKPTT